MYITIFKAAEAMEEEWALLFCIAEILGRFQNLHRTSGQLFLTNIYVIFPENIVNYLSFFV